MFYLWFLCLFLNQFYNLSLSLDESFESSKLERGNRSSGRWLKHYHVIFAPKAETVHDATPAVTFADDVLYSNHFLYDALNAVNEEFPSNPGTYNIIIYNPEERRTPFLSWLSKITGFGSGHVGHGGILINRVPIGNFPQRPPPLYPTNTPSPSTQLSTITPPLPISTILPAPVPAPVYEVTTLPSQNNYYCNVNCMCGVTNKMRRIVGGHETDVNEYPWMAQLIYAGRFYCGGTLINDRFILTAAHCVKGFNLSYIMVRLLNHNRGNPNNVEKIDRNVERIIHHSHYDASSYNNDIALLLLDKKVDFRGLLRPACLPTAGRPYSNETGIVTGWGAVRENGMTSDTLMEVKVPILPNSVCKRSVYGANRITDNMLCAGAMEGMIDSCQGDSGGPLHVAINGVRHEVVGVVSWGEGCAKPNSPGVYTRVNRYLTWIRSNAQGGCYC